MTTAKKKNGNWLPILTLILQTLTNFFASLRSSKKSDTPPEED